MIRILTAAALAALIAVPASAQSRQGSDRAEQSARVAKSGKSAQSAAKPCAARTWAGCRGWDPDPNVRSMIQMDAGHDDR